MVALRTGTPCSLVLHQACSLGVSGPTRGRLRILACSLPIDGCINFLRKVAWKPRHRLLVGGRIIALQAGRVKAVTGGNLLSDPTCSATRPVQRTYLFSEPNCFPQPSNSLLFWVPLADLTKGNMGELLTSRHSRDCSTWVAPSQAAENGMCNRSDNAEGNPGGLVRLPRNQLRRQLLLRPFQAICRKPLRQ